MKVWVVLLLLVTPATILGQHGHGKAQPSPMLISGLGEVHHPVSTKESEAQKFFNQGLACIYGFNHEEAIRSFNGALDADPQLAMAHWGIALALGAHYNMAADGPSLAQAYSHLQKARMLAEKASEHDRAYIEALAKRYSSESQADPQQLALAYKTAMEGLVRLYPDDLDAATLYAESMMNLRPWRLWTTDGQPAEGTLEILSVLESVIRRNPNHPGANHYYIHAVEASNDPKRALESAARLGQLAPKAGHLVHMPSHIYIRTGDYNKAAQVNADALLVDQEYLKLSGMEGAYSSITTTTIDTFLLQHKRCRVAINKH